MSVSNVFILLMVELGSLTPGQVRSGQVRVFNVHIQSKLL